jgi:hypothetical protein
VARALTIERGYGQLRPDTEPASIEPAVAAARLRVRLQFDEPLPEGVLGAAADTLRRHPDVRLRAYGRRVDPGLGWLLRSLGLGLRALSRTPAETLRLLLLERLTGLTTLVNLAACTRREQLGLYETRPSDRRLDVLRLCPRLNRLVVADPYTADQMAALRAGFTAETLALHGSGTVRGNIAAVLVRWRTPVTRLLEALGEATEQPFDGR